MDNTVVEAEKVDEDSKSDIAFLPDIIIQETERKTVKFEEFNPYS